MNYSPAWEAGGWDVAAALFAAALAAASLILYSRRGRPRTLKLLRLGAIAALALCLLKLSVERSVSKTAKPRLAVVIDTGLSMGAKDGSGKTRLERAALWLLSHRGEIESRSDPVFYAGADHARRVQWSDLSALPVSAAGFDFPTVLREASEDGAASRFWLFSDGIAEETQGTDQVLKDLKAPVDTVGTGPRGTGRSVAITEVKTPDFVFQHSRFSVGVSLEAAELAGGTVDARLMKGHDLVAERQLPVRGDYEILDATFTAEAQSLGREEYRLDLQARAPSGSSHKAGRAFQVEVIRKKYRIMYLAGRPSPEYAALREQLKSDPNHELVSFVILRNPENASLFSDQELSLIPFPAQEIFVQNLFQFDIFILQNFAYWRFNLPPAYLEALKQFVSRGGALLVIGGSNAYSRGGYRGTPLEDLLPVDLWNSAEDYVPGTFQPRVLLAEHPMLSLAETPRESAAMWSSLPPLDGFNRFAAVKPGATVLLAHPTEKTPDGRSMPLMALREYGKGKVLVIGTDSTWRWKLGSGLEWKTSAFYGRFWSRAVQYLTGTLDLKRVKFSPLPERMPPREPAVLTLHIFDESFHPLPPDQTELKAIWGSPDGKYRTVPAVERETGVYEIDLTGLSAGPQTVRAVARWRGQVLGEDQVRFLWEPQPPEMPLRRRWLKEVSDGSSGRYADLARVPVSEWLALLPPPRAEREVVRRWRLWNSSAWLWAVSAALLAEWILRRRRGYA